MNSPDPTIVNMFEAKTNLYKLVARVQKGERIILAKNGTPVADITPHKPKKRTVKFGTLADKIHCKDEDIMGIDPDIMEMFYGKDWENM